MTRAAFLYSIVALIAVVVVGSVVYLESASTAAATPPTSTTTSTSTTTTTTTTPTTSTTTTTTTTSTSTTLPPTTLAPTTTSPPPERSQVPIVVASGSLTGARVKPTAFILSSLGWSNVRDLNGSLPFAATVVYFAVGQQAAAELLAIDAGLPAAAVAPMTEAPPVAGLADAQLLLYLGG